MAAVFDRVKGVAIVGANESVANTRDAVLSLVFAKGHRPDADDIRALAGVADAVLPFSISHDASARHGWIELLAMGLTFDCTGIAPAVAAKAPPPGPLLGLDIRPQGEAISLMPGPHLAEGRALLPVVRTMAGLGARLSTMPGLLAVCWRPARSWMAPGYFQKTVADWLAGGPFPALGLTTLHRQGDGAMVSHGLGYFIGQEVRVEPGHGREPAAIARIAVRLINELVLAGPLRRAERLVGPGGEALLIEPRPDGAMVNVIVSA